jgi:ABC-2 type transport system permease protein
MADRFLALARTTFLETIRQPIYGVILVVTAILLILNVALTAFTLDNDNKLLLDVSLSTLLLSGLFLSAFSASGVLAREIENKTVLIVVSKPVSRPLFVAGKFGGLLAALFLAYYLSFLVFVLCVRHGVMQNTSDPWDGPVLVLGFGSLFVALLVGAFCNYFYGREFSTTTIAFLAPLLTVSVLVVALFDKKWNMTDFAADFVGGQVIIAAYLVFLAVVISSAVALAASTRLGQLMTLVVCLCVLGAGVASDYAFGQYVETSNTARAFYGAIPNMGPFWVVDGLTAGTQETTVTGEYVGYATAYAALLTVGIFGLAVALFERREVG